MKSGFIVVDKDSGFTSHDVVAIARKSLSERRVGHAGTLDPFATGVLVLGVGNGTRLLQYITDGKKSYEGVIRLGSATTTDDLTGETVSSKLTGLSEITDDAIIFALEQQIGEIYQRPSNYSAIKIDGKRAYQLARAGVDIELKERRVSIYSLKVLQIARHELGIDIQILVDCSAGTYIRSIARDVGERLAVGGHLIALRRTAVMPFTLAEAMNIDQLRTNPTLLSIDGAIERIFPRRTLTAEEVASVSHGRSIELAAEREQKCAAFTPEGTFIALLAEKGGRAQPVLVISRIEQ
jgi:tRNA pseudouridine55 synthase